MILAAALLVLVALGLFVGGIVTGNTTLYWACVGVSAGAAVLLVLARRQLGRPVAGPASREEPPALTKETARTVTTATEATAATGAATPAEVPPADVPPAEVPPAEEPAVEVPPQAAAHGTVPVESAGAAPDGAAPDGAAPDGEAPVEEVEVTDLLLVVDLRDEVLVVDEHPRYHLAGCPRLTGEETIPLPVDEARQDGFTPCGVCAPDRHLADAERARRAARRAP